MKIGIYGNCQHTSYREVLAKLLPDSDVISLLAEEGPELLNDCDVVLCQTDYEHAITQSKFKGRIINIPTFYFLGFHPDLVIEPVSESSMLIGPAGSLQSALILHGFLRGYSADRIEELFTPETYEILGYHDYWHRSIKFMTDNLNTCGLDGPAVVRAWIKQGVFCHTANHPTVEAIEVVCRELIGLLGLVTDYKGTFKDPLKWHGVWPVYPGIAESHGIIGSLNFEFGDVIDGARRQTMTLIDFINASIKMYERQISKNYSPNRFLDNRNYEKLSINSKLKSRNHVYSNLPASSYWKKSISSQSIYQVDPVISPRFKITKSSKIITAGSCFAQHIAKKLTADGFNYYIAELPPAGMPPEEALKRGYGLFSARYGNLYTARQLRLLVERSLGMFTPADTAWQRPDGRWVDPYRPQLDPKGYDSAEAVVEEAERHLSYVRQMFFDADVFVFTLGLTECWIAKSDGSAFPTAPGVVAGEMDPERYGFVNFRVSDVRDDLSSAIRLIRAQNPTMRFILTVSPVPLVATFEKKHVLTATTYSKSALRAAVDEIVAMFDFVEYFPSYEIITGNYAMGNFFEADKREVNKEGVSKVMGLLQQHYFDMEEIVTSTGSTQIETSDISETDINSAFSKEFARSSAILCDEELLDQNDR